MKPAMSMTTVYDMASTRSLNMMTTEELDADPSYSKPIGRIITSEIADGYGEDASVTFLYGDFEDLKKGGQFSFIEKCETQFINYCFIHVGLHDGSPEFATRMHEEFCNHISGEDPLDKHDLRYRSLPFWDRLEEEWASLSDEDRYLFLD
jgi:hypothetical protein